MGQFSQVVVVEDDAVLRTLLVELVKEFTDAHVCAFESGEDAIAYLGEAIDVDLVITDVVLSGVVTGLDVAAFVAEIRPSVAVIVTSALHMYASLIPATASFLAKPFDIANLEGMMQNLAAIERDS